MFPSPMVTQKGLYLAYEKAPEKVGQVVVDDFGDLWRLCKCTVDTIYGAVVRQAADILTGTATTAAAIGSRRLIDTSAFASLTYNDLIGAEGFGTAALAEGGGQSFWITDRLSDDEVQIWNRAYTSAAGVADHNPASNEGGWAVAVTTSFTYGVNIPGRCRLAVEGITPYGVCQVKDGGVDASEKPYAYMKLTGLADCIGDASDNAFIVGEGVHVAASTAGYVQGPNATTAPTAPENRSYVGVAMHGDITFDCLVRVDLQIPPLGAGHVLTRPRHPLNAVDIG